MAEPACTRGHGTSTQARLFRSIMQASDGLCSVELDLAAAAVSRANGCNGCSPALVEEGAQADLSPRWRALIDYAVALSETPPAAGANELAALRLVGLSDLEILDATHAIALIAWIDRSRAALVATG